MGETKKLAVSILTSKALKRGDNSMICVGFFMDACNFAHDVINHFTTYRHLLMVYVWAINLKCEKLILFYWEVFRQVPIFVNLGLYLS